MWYLISKLILKIIGWKNVDHIPKDVKKYIVVVGPHTSYWDFPIGILSRSYLKRKIGFIAKAEVFKFPFGPILKWMGGIPVDRSKKSNLVEIVKDLFESRSELAICIAPEGTRKKVRRLKTGFYHMAKEANVPITLCTFDFKTKTVTYHKPYYVSDNKEEAIAEIWEFFSGVEGKFPELGIG